ncbi:MAG TPA: hypothetical protein VN641_08730 [Urbifossiella sp.]|nr:hypothetical protein [Urbifossiella sp.]
MLSRIESHRFLPRLRRPPLRVRKCIDCDLRFIGQLVQSRIAAAYPKAKEVEQILTDDDIGRGTGYRHDDQGTLANLAILNDKAEVDPVATRVGEAPAIEGRVERVSSPAEFLIQPQPHGPDPWEHGLGELPGQFAIEPPQSLEQWVIYAETFYRHCWLL